MGVSKLSLSLLALAGSSVAADLPSIVSKGSKLFLPSGEQFFMKGMAYQQDTAAAGATFSQKTKFVDPLANADNCKRDIPLLKELGINIIRTYAIDPTADHSACMQQLNDAGIYVISDLGEPNNSINRDTPRWDVDLFQRYKDVVDELGQYSNVIGFFAGNEVSNNNTNTGASAFVKAAVRDTRKYISDNKSRWMGVGYAANDDADIRDNMAHYFNCGDDGDRIDFWGYNIYSWCGHSNMQKSGYSTETEFFKSYSVPVFFAEYGCNIPDGAAGRLFEETAALYSPVMADVFTGGIVYMYFEEANDYGVVQVQGNTVSKLPDFDTLKTQNNKAHPKGVTSDSYKPTNVPSTCPKVGDTWAASENLPPTPDTDSCDCMVESRLCVPSKDLSPKDYGHIFDYVCGKFPDACAGIKADPESGVYGAYSMCAPDAQLAYVLDAYYNSQKQAASACDFNGQAVLQKANEPGSCEKMLASASSINSQAATATSAPTGSSDSSQEDFAAPGASFFRFTIGNFALGLYMVVAMTVGAGMVML